MTEEMLQRLMGVISTQACVRTDLAAGSFSRCTARFNGSRNSEKVQEFTTTIVLYKDIESIPDEMALRGLPLLLQDTADLSHHINLMPTATVYVLATGIKTSPLRVIIDTASDRNYVTESFCKSAQLEITPIEAQVISIIGVLEVLNSKRLDENLLINTI
ncbi:activity-regulated cytoskeleton associated protein 1-like [Ctenocephalides felis]|uniref:activity-regulated cytoskeleton associated protein 1-like n=1 Tax=Ctenocephalides felis TaxID=7515 RepID=UPI000E6E4A5D|nr:activity-regulated cytoskeleton associated protein 1-like [Ctenocephalides felis]